MSEMEVSRRDLLRGIALAALAGGVTVEAAQHVHHAAEEEKKTAGGVYKPKCFTSHEYGTLRKLADMIVPADDISKSAAEAGAADFIDLLCSQNDELATLYTGGIAWLDAQMLKRYSANFIEAKEDQRTAMLDLIAYRKNETPDLGPGIRFFDWARRMTVDAFYTSAAGIKDVGYKGNAGMTKFEVPAEALQYALERSGLA